MNTLTILQHITPHQNITKPNQWSQIHPPFNQNRRETPFPPPPKWQLQSGAKGFTGNPKNKEAIETMKNKRNNDDDDDDDKIPDVVWKRMIPRILFYVGVPLVFGFALLQAFSLLKEGGFWDVPIWLPFSTTFLTFGASALGIAIGSLSTSLDAEKEGSLLGFEQLEKNWDEMWKEEDEPGNR